MWVAFAMFVSKNIRIYAIFNDQSFNDTLTNVMTSLVLNNWAQEYGKGSYWNFMRWAENGKHTIYTLR